MMVSSQQLPTRVPSSKDPPGADLSMNEAVLSTNATGDCHSLKTGNQTSPFSDQDT